MQLLLFRSLQEVLWVRLRMNDPNKAPDLLIKKKKKWLIVEAKHLNTSGGEQNKQIQELIDFIAIDEKREDIFYIAFMDGAYSNRLLLANQSLRSSKRKSQRDAIVRNLKKHPHNYWLNTAGFIKFIKDL